MQREMSPKLRVSGLDNVDFAQTRLSHVDGERGQLIIGGYPCEVLAEMTSFEGVAHLLWHGELAVDAELKQMEERFGGARVVAFSTIKGLKDVSNDAMDFVRMALASLPDQKNGPTFELVVAAVAVAAATWNRQRQGLPPLPPDPDCRHAEDYLRMALGGPPDARLTRALDAYLVTVADHGMNASTFTARIVASTGADLLSAVIAAIGAPSKGRCTEARQARFWPC